MKQGYVGFLMMCLFTLSVMASNDGKSEIPLLDNRFRIDPSVKEITFVVYRKKNSEPAILVRPDGSKLYAWRHPSNVTWHEENDLDIISIKQPMPGPWQAIGDISTKNKIVILSELSMSVDTLPERLYKDERLKFTARLTQDGKPVHLRSFLDNIELKVIFTESVDSLETLPISQHPKGIVIGQFFDDGLGYDERAGDGVFTVDLHISPPPGKYTAQVTSGNGVFFRALAQSVLVFPTPVTASFESKVTDKKPAHLSITSQSETVVPGSLAVHAEFFNPENVSTVYEGAAGADASDVSLVIEGISQPGQYKWYAHVYGNDKNTDRPLVFGLPEQTFAIVDFATLEKAKKEREAREKEKQAEEEALQIAQEKEKAKKTAILTIVGGNLILLLLTFVGYIVFRYLQKKKWHS